MHMYVNTMWFKSYEHFHYLITDRWTDSYSYYSADPRVVQKDFMRKQVLIHCNFIEKQVCKTVTRLCPNFFGKA